MTAITLPLEKAQQIEEALAGAISDSKSMGWITISQEQALSSIREAINQSGYTTDIVKRPQNCGTGYCSCIECVIEPSSEEKACSNHQDAPHGFDRNASHNAGRYVCECECWTPEATK